MILIISCLPEDKVILFKIRGFSHPNFNFLLLVLHNRTQKPTLSMKELDGVVVANNHVIRVITESDWQNFSHLAPNRKSGS